ncbi:MAG: hypothetical protein M5R36_11305 [Deltaproteobacteria bacterium]|nr:hypothetical protein [Deltaproteobacteria bacterium]
MVDAAERMQRFIRDLLTYARVDARPKTRALVSLNVVMDAVLGDLSLAVQEHGARIDVGPLPAVEADVTMIRQLFQNLVGNALKYKAEGRPPHITVRAEETNAAPGLCRGLNIFALTLRITESGSKSAMPSGFLSPLNVCTDATNTGNRDRAFHLPKDRPAPQRGDRRVEPPGRRVGLLGFSPGSGGKT